MRFELAGKVKGIERAWYLRQPNLAAVHVEAEREASLGPHVSATLTIYVSEEDAKSFVFGQKITLKVASDE